jgi:hypothetical protein
VVSTNLAIVVVLYDFQIRWYIQLPFGFKGLISWHLTFPLYRQIKCCLLNTLCCFHMLNDICSYKHMLGYYLKIGHIRFHPNSLSQSFDATYPVLLRNHCEVLSYWWIFNGSRFIMYGCLNGFMYSRPSSNVGDTFLESESVNPRWTNLILYGINGDTGTRPRKVKVNKQ